MSTKKLYQSHKYLPPRKSKGKSAAAFKRHHGIENLSRSKVWGQEVKPRSIQGKELKTYSRKRPFIKQEDEPTAINKSDGQQPIVAGWPFITENEDDSNHSFSFETCEENDPLAGLGGNRVINIHHMFQWTLSLQSDHSKVCTKGIVEFADETRIGLYSKFNFICKLCSKTWTFGSHLNEDKINEAFVWGSLTSGSSYSQTSHIFTTMDIPVMTLPMFSTIKQNLENVWEDKKP